MSSNYVLLLVLMLFKPAQALLLWQHAESKYDERCTFENRAYTGVRIFHERVTSLSSKIALSKQVVILECSGGHEMFNLTMPSNTTIFNTEFEVDDGSKLIKIVRRPGYQNSDKLKYIPGTIVGGVYQSSLPETLKGEVPEWKPLSPLIADGWTMGSHDTHAQNKTALITIRTSLLRSPDVLEKSYPQSLLWTEQIPDHEVSEV